MIANIGTKVGVILAVVDMVRKLKVKKD